jgi:hypothetical protein
MHPWMLEQVASEHRRDLLARASRARLTRPSARHWWRSWGRTRSAQPGPGPSPLRPVAAGPSVVATGPVTAVASASPRPRLRLVR